MVKSKKTIIKNIFKVSSSNIIKLISGVLVGLLLPRIMGIRDYGLYKTFTLYTSYVGLLMLGICDGIYLKYGGFDFDNLPKNKFLSYTRFFIFIELFLSALLIIISVFLLEHDFKYIFICVSVYLLLTNVTGYFQIVSQITSRFSELSFRNVIQSLLIGLSVVVLWILNHYFNFLITYSIYVVLYLCILFFTTLWYVYTYRRLIFDKTDYPKKRAIKDIVRFSIIGIPLTVANLCSTLILNIDRQFVNVLFDTENYAIYAFAYNMLSLITTAISAIAIVIYPYLKKASITKLIKSYNVLLFYIILIVFFSLAIYFPLTVFIPWFLPKYIDSLPIFRIVLPGLAMSSTITIVMHNYYKTLGKSHLFFIESIIVLIISIFFDILAYSFFHSMEAISIASILAMIIWYLLINSFFVKKYKVGYYKNFMFMILMVIVFYLASLVNPWWISMLIYLIFLFSLACVVFRDELSNILTSLKEKRA